MFSLELECVPEQKDLLIADLWEQGSAGIVELAENRLRAFFEDTADRAALRVRFAACHPAERNEEERDWVAFAQTRIEPMEVGALFFIAPEWRSDPTPPGRFRIEVNPGMAFGTGIHETTQLCLEALERHVKPGMSVLDVGTGSGILAYAGKLLGAGAVRACDTDPQAVEIARARVPDVFTGSVDAVAAGSCGLVVANISPEAIVALAPDLLRVLEPDGIALLSGFETHEAAAIGAALGRPTEFFAKGAWALVTVK